MSFNGLLSGKTSFIFFPLSMNHPGGTVQPKKKRRQRAPRIVEGSVESLGGVLMETVKVQTSRGPVKKRKRIAPPPVQHTDTIEGSSEVHDSMVDQETEAQYHEQRTEPIPGKVSTQILKKKNVHAHRNS